MIQSSSVAQKCSRMAITRDCNSHSPRKVGRGGRRKEIKKDLSFAYNRDGAVSISYFLITQTITLACLKETDNFRPWRLHELNTAGPISWRSKISLETFGEI